MALMTYSLARLCFLHVPVILSTGGSLYDVTSCLAAWSHVPSRGLPPGGSVSEEGEWAQIPPCPEKWAVRILLEYFPCITSEFTYQFVIES